FLFSTDINSAVRGTIPEPGTLALAGLALAAIGGLARRRKFF
ncbi:MAG TPA: PEP-CTERM sorting domain-containing protein, partial [Rhodocyclaceae bacterium]|nr:PEP-CTERM sorting domain-containing protein [Rhodocyclaceae bacterium]